MYYTPQNARIRTRKEWERWHTSLKDGDRVLIQQFVPQGHGCLESSVEGWRLYEGVYKGTDVFYKREPHPVKDGVFRYHGSDEPWGDVFDARIVPSHAMLPDLNKETIFFHAPIFEPEWVEQFRCLCLAENGKDKLSAYHTIKKSFPRIYRRKVEEGDLVITFGDRDEIRSAVDGIPGIQFLYSEFLEGL